MVLEVVERWSRLPVPKHKLQFQCVDYALSPSPGQLCLATKGRHFKVAKITV